MVDALHGVFNACMHAWETRSTAIIMYMPRCCIALAFLVCRYETAGSDNLERIEHLCGALISWTVIEE